MPTVVSTLYCNFFLIGSSISCLFSACCQSVFLFVWFLCVSWYVNQGCGSGL